MPLRCIVTGGGPAGMMTGFLLARAGVEVAVLEKHPDFNRDFRGDTIHPSTFELMHELGLLEEFLQVPHQEARELHAVFNGHDVPIADFTHLPTACQFIGLMPQWDFLNFLARHARSLPAFHLHMETKVTDLIMENGRVVGVRTVTPEGDRELRADLVIGADGRHSTVRARAGLPARDLGAPIDVLWMRLSRQPNDPAQTGGYFENGLMMVAINREEYWQCAMIIPKDHFAEMKTEGLPALRERIGRIVPFLRERAAELTEWDQVKLLTVQIGRLTSWASEGVLCIGDSAHAMSPAGGVGINLAIQDAVATANLLADKLHRGPVTLDDLREVQRRREWPTKLIQAVQVFIHRRINGQPRDRPVKLPLVLRLFRAFPILRRLPARFVGIGPRPEHVRSPKESGLTSGWSHSSPSK